MASWKIFSDLAANKVTADVGCVHMLISSARVWRSLRVLWSHDEIGLHSAYLNVAITTHGRSGMIGCPS